MKLLITGVSHKTAPVEVRECLAFREESLPQSLTDLKSRVGVHEALILSTCNRVEIALTTEDGADPAAVIDSFLSEQKGISPAAIHPHVYRHEGRDAIHHLFRVAASLDSMVVGEPQILGQLKAAYAAAKDSGTCCGWLESLMTRAFSVAKRVRSETGIGQMAVSVSYAAVELSRKIFGSLNNRTIMIVGAGKMSELAARHLAQQGAGTILVSNRTRDRAARVAEAFGGRVIPFEQLYEVASEADIVISSTGAPHPIFRREHGQAFLHKRRNRPMFFIDIAVPRDVDPAMNRLDGIFVYDIDDLQQVAAAHMEERSREAVDAEALIEAEVERFHQRQRAVNVAPAIVALQRRAEEIRQGEIERSRARLGDLSPEQSAALDALTRGLVNKFLHPPMQAIKQAAREGDSARLDALCEEWSVMIRESNDSWQASDANTQAAEATISEDPERTAEEEEPRRSEVRR